MGEIAFFLKKILTPLVLPPTSLVLGVMLGLVLMRRWPRFGRWVAWAGLTLLLMLSLPSVATLLVHSITLDSAVASERGRAAQAIVILGGGRMPAPEYGGMTVSSATLERIRYGAKLAHELQLPVLVTGGAVYGSGPAEGELMAQALQESFATPVRWIEAKSRDTHENAVLSAALLAASGIHTVLLVTHDLHQRRAIREFAAAGIDAVPAPITTVAKSGKRALPAELPSAGALGLSSQALHEILGAALLAPGKAAAR